LNKYTPGFVGTVFNCGANFVNVTEIL